MELIRQTLGIAVVFTALAGLRWWSRRRGLATFRPFDRMRQKPRQLEAVERLSLTPHHALHVVRFQGRELLIASHATGCVLLKSQRALLESSAERQMGAEA